MIDQQKINTDDGLVKKATAAEVLAFLTGLKNVPSGTSAEISTKIRNLLDVENIREHGPATVAVEAARDDGLVEKILSIPEADWPAEASKEKFRRAWVAILKTVGDHVIEIIVE